MTNTDSLERIRKALEAGPSEGEWKLKSMQSYATEEYDTYLEPLGLFIHENVSDADAEWLAAANPVAIRSLLAREAALRREVKELRADAKKWREWFEAQRMIEEDMPEGYRVILECSPGDWSLRFTDPDGEDIHIDYHEDTAHFIREAVSLARAALASTEPTKD